MPKVVVTTVYTLSGSEERIEEYLKYLRSGRVKPIEHVNDPLLIRGWGINLYMTRSLTWSPVLPDDPPPKT